MVLLSPYLAEIVLLVPPPIKLLYPPEIVLAQPPPIKPQSPYEVEIELS